MTFATDSIQITAIDNELIRFASRERRELPGMAPRFDIHAGDSLVYGEITSQVLALDLDDPVLDAVRQERVELGYTAGQHVAAVMNWLSDQPLVLPKTERSQKQRPPRCRRCHRRLTDPESIARGIGPECWAKDGHR